MRVLLFVTFSIQVVMNTIVIPDTTFDFTKVTLSHPSSIQGGAYFTKILYNGAPLYIQTPKCLTKQSIVKTGKRFHCDLMFENIEEQMIHWFEHLESKCQTLLLDKNSDWFQNSLELNDIESAFVSILRIYKSGKYYLVRTNVKSNSANEPSIRIYNENEVNVSTIDLTPETKIITILEIQGIKFTSRNFQVEIECKQIMTINDEPIFESCLIKTNKPLYTKPLATQIQEPIVEDTTKNDSLTNASLTNDDVSLVDTENDIISKPAMESEEIVIDYDNLEDDIEAPDLVEVTMDAPMDSTESITLKQPNQVYFELYKNARTKAKAAKKAAIIAYLEAKNIKKTYMLENMDDSDSDFDAEIDEVSESELDGL